MLLLAVGCASALRVVPRRPSPGSWRRTQCGWRNGEELNHSANPRWPAATRADGDIPTRWGRQVDAQATPLPEYPRPQLVRGAGANATRLRDAGDPSGWASLNGLWEWQAAAPGDHEAETEYARAALQAVVEAARRIKTDEDANEYFPVYHIRPPVGHGESSSLWWLRRKAQRSCCAQ